MLLAHALLFLQNCGMRGEGSLLELALWSCVVLHQAMREGIYMSLEVVTKSRGKKLECARAKGACAKIG